MKAADVKARRTSMTTATPSAFRAPASKLKRWMRGGFVMSDPDPEVPQRIADAGVDVAMLPVGLAQAGVSGHEDPAF